MEFIEKLCGLSPDGGSGATELAFFLVPLLIVVVVVWRRYAVRTIHRTRSGG